MFRKSLNRALLRVRVDTVTPLLIRAGMVGLEPVGADLVCVRTRHAKEGQTVYVPGSSFKGVVRSAAEASVRGLVIARVAGACDPLDHRTCCGSRAANLASSAEKHRAHCLACRLFGSTTMKGRASLRDLFPWRGAAVADDRANFERANRVEIRHGVSINRISGAVQHHGPFDQEVVPAGVSFWGDVALENYQLWQLGLLLQGFDALNEGTAQLGSSKSRGLGVVRVEVEALVHEQRPGDVEAAAGVGRLVAADEVDAYGLFADAVITDARGTRRGLAVRFHADETAAVGPWLAAGRDALAALA